MTVPDRDKRSGLRDEVLAGEYVLGVLPPDDMAELERRVGSDRQFAAMVKRWQENLAETAYREKAAIAVLLKDDPVRQKLVSRGMPSGKRAMLAAILTEVWNSVRFWRLLALTAMLWTAVLLFSIA
ncbi:hypothetical protein [Agrobacterium tumefaciens]|uniref:hypothetical protein n=1 Tax=Agrobacterium tumefaciens TaxID=358 RepID=UPI0021D23F74|nr:hypothetical protein [Agrobacterium tumefaciens]UXS00037.1 hypothetical protein FY156_00285 [Agrobacterium tumefaciens]